MIAMTPALRETRSSQASSPRGTYLRVLAWAFTLFNSVRVAAYLPTMWAISCSTTWMKTSGGWASRESHR